MTARRPASLQQDRDPRKTRRTPQPIFVEAAGWPIEPGALAALIDIGISNSRIAEYFAVGLTDVLALRGRYGFGE